MPYDGKGNANSNTTTNNNNDKILLWTKIKLKREKKPAYQLVLIPRLSTFWPLRNWTRPCYSHHGQGPSSPCLILGNRNSANECSQFTGLRSQKICCWSLRADRPAICATSLSLPGKKKRKREKEGQTRQEDGTNTNICSKLTGPSGPPAGTKWKQTQPCVVHFQDRPCSGSISFSPTPLPWSPLWQDLIMGLSEGSQASFHLKRRRYFASELETLFDAGN